MLKWLQGVVRKKCMEQDHCMANAWLRNGETITMKDMLELQYQLVCRVNNVPPGDAGSHELLWLNNTYSDNHVAVTRITQPAVLCYCVVWQAPAREGATVMDDKDRGQWYYWPVTTTQQYWTRVLPLTDHQPAHWCEGFWHNRGGEEGVVVLAIHTVRGRGLGAPFRLPAEAGLRSGGWRHEEALQTLDNCRRQ